MDARDPHLARPNPVDYLAPIGGTYSSEWLWSKVWHCLNVAPDVFAAAATWVELADFVPAVLASVNDPRNIVRCVCAAGHKAMYSRAWGGLPAKDFLARLDPRLAELRDRLYEEAHSPHLPAGTLSPAWAEEFGLHAGIPIAMGGFDAHYGAVGAGVAPGTLVGGGVSELCGRRGHRAASRAGMRSVGVGTGNVGAADVVVASLADLPPEAFEELLG